MQKVNQSRTPFISPAAASFTAATISSYFAGRHETDPPQYNFFGVAKKGIESPFFLLVLCVYLYRPLRCAVLCAVLSSASCCPLCSTVLCVVLSCVRYCPLRCAVLCAVLSSAVCCGALPLCCAVFCAVLRCLCAPWWCAACAAQRQDSTTQRQRGAAQKRYM